MLEDDEHEQNQELEQYQGDPGDPPGTEVTGEDSGVTGEELVQLPPETSVPVNPEGTAEPAARVDDPAPRVGETKESKPAGRTLAERTRAHVMEQCARDPEMRDLTPEEAYNEIKDSEDLNYDLHEDCREIDKLLQQVGSGKYAVGDYVVARRFPPIQVTRFGHIYWHHKPTPRYRDLVNFPELPCSKSELADCVALALQKRSLDELNQGNPGYADHLSISQLILLTRVKDLADKCTIIEHLKKHPKKFLETKEWMREKGFLRGAKEVDQTKKLVEGFERVVKNAEANLPALEDTDPDSFGFNVLTGWRERLAVVVSLLAALEAEQGEKAA